MDDNTDVAAALAWLLELHGCSVDIAFSGRGGLEQVRRQHRDLLVVDLNMPGINGMDLVRIARDEGLVDLTYCVCCSALGDDPTLRDALQRAGFDRVIAKPASADDLAGIVGEANERRQ